MLEILESEEHSKDAEIVKGLVQGILKAKKILKIYPPNNPVRVKTTHEAYSDIKKILDTKNELSLKILQNEIIFDNEQVYFNPGKENNLALLFFKDGIRQITFLKGFSQNEFEDLLNILNTDFENVVLEDDIVTLLWERDFENLKYLATEELLSEEDYENSNAYEDLKNKITPDDNYTNAYYDGLKAPEKLSTIPPLSITDTELKYIASEMEEDRALSKIDKIVSVFFELLYLTKDDAIYHDIVDFIKKTLFYCIKNGDFKMASSILDSIKSVIKDENLGEENIKVLTKIYTTINSLSFIHEIGKTLDSDIKIDENEFTAFVRHLDRTSIPSFIQLLGEPLGKSRHLIVDSLSIIGRLDIKSLADGLNDSRWQVAKNIIIILGKIADSRSVEFLIKALAHPDERIRKEALRAIGFIGGTYIPFSHLKKALEDNIPSVRMTAARTLGSTKTEVAREILLDKITRKNFLSKSFSEKKEFYAAISHWQDQEIIDFLRTTLKKKRFWKRAKNDETRACAAYAIGQIGDKEAIPYLEKTRHSKNRLLNEFSNAALNRLKN